MKKPEGIKRVVKRTGVVWETHSGASVAPGHSYVMLYLTKRGKERLGLSGAARLAFAELNDGRWALIEDDNAKERKIHAKHQAIQFYGIYMTGKKNLGAEILDGIAYWPADTFTTDRPALRNESCE